MKSPFVNLPNRRSSGGGPLGDVVLSADEGLFESFISIEGIAVQHGLIPLELTREVCTAQAEMALRLLGRRADGGEPWMPISTLGPMIVFAHHSPRSQDFWGVPDFLGVKVVISEAQYEAVKTDFLARVGARPLPERGKMEDVARPFLDIGDLRGTFEWFLENYPWDKSHLKTLETGYRELIKRKPAPDVEDFNRLHGHLGVALRVVCEPGTLALNPDDAPKQTLFPPALLDKHGVYPAYCGKQRIYLLTGGGDTYPFEDEWLSSGNDPMEVAPVLADVSAIKKVVNRSSGAGNEITIEISESDYEVSDDAAVVELVPEDILQINPQNVNHTPEEMLQWCLYRALHLRASDLHIEKYYNTIRFRARIDGELKVIFSASEEMLHRYIAMVKNYANMNQSRQETQDGRISLAIGRRRVDVRVAAVPCRKEFQKVVMRFLDKDGGMKSMGDLKLSERQSTLFERAMSRDQGLILITGPTGSGKTTTLYALLNSVNDENVNLHTIEDPIEYRIEGINQTQTDPFHGITFATGLRALLRSDPDVILIGECRDEETATAAVTSALTGHLVLTTLHANDSLRAISRLLSMGVPSFLLADSLVLSQAQRLVRRLCEYCKRPKLLTPEQVHLFGQYGMQDLASDAVVFEHGSCDECYQTGYSGRLALMEITEVSPEIKDLITENAPISRIREIAQKSGLRTLYQEGLVQVLKGNTTLDEIKGLAYMAPACMD